MAIVLPVILQNPYLITTLTSSITAISYGINKYILSDNSDNIFKETSQFETDEDFVNIINACIPVPPNISEYLLKKESYLKNKSCNIELKIKTRYKDFDHFKKCRNNRNKRKRQKLNRTNK
jgi:hypothetical protein